MRELKDGFDIIAHDLKTPLTRLRSIVDRFVCLERYCSRPENGHCLSKARAILKLHRRKLRIEDDASILCVRHSLPLVDHA